MIVAGALVAAAVLVLVRPWWTPARTVGQERERDRVESWSGPRPFRAGGPVWGALLGVSALAAPPAAVLVLVWPTVRAVRRARIAAVFREQEVIRALPESVDLLIVGVGAGLSPRAAIEAALPWMPEPIGPSLGIALARSERGEPLADALAAACRSLGESVLPVVNLLGGGAGELGVGARLPALIRLGDDARRRRRADAQERARRLPVTMLVPLVCCVLPAFVLIGLVPLVVASLGDLGIGP